MSATTPLKRHQGNEEVEKRSDELGSQLCEAAENGDTSEVSRLLQLGANKNYSEKNSGSTPLWCACVSGHTEIVTMLLKAGADPDKQANDGWTPLHVACWKGHTEIVTMLLKAGADPNKQDNDRKTPLHVACVNRRTEIVRMLLKAGADIELETDDGKTAITIAGKNGYLEIVMMIEEHQKKRKMAEVRAIAMACIGVCSPAHEFACDTFLLRSLFDLL
jgi:ankyrin repeat protein